MKAYGGERGEWGNVEHLLANIFDAVQATNYLTLRAHFKSTATPPQPLRRPGTPVDDGQRVGGRHVYSPAAMRKLLDAQRREGVTVTHTEEVS